MRAWVLAAKTTAMEVYYRLLVTLWVLDTYRLVVQNSDSHLICRIVGWQISMIGYIFSLELFSSGWDLSEFFISHRVILILLSHGQFWSQHRHKDLRVGLDWVENNLSTFFDELVIIHKIEEEKHCLVVVLVGHDPVPELIGSVLRIESVSCTVAYQRDSFHNCRVMVCRLKNGCAPYHYIVHCRPQL